MKKIFLFLLLSLLICSTKPVYGREEGVSLSISPLIREIDIEPGTSWEGEVEIFNTNSRDLQFEISTLDFKGRGEGYAQYIQKIDDEGNLALTNWIHLEDESVSIPANSSEKVAFTINPPEQAPPGGVYAAIIASAKGEGAQNKEGVNVSPSVSSLMLVNIEGDFFEKISVLEFSSPDLFYDQNEIPFYLKIINMGNVHIRPEGNISIYNSQGEKMDELTINKEKGYGNILPQSERSWDFKWEADESLFQVGEYKAVLNLIYGRSQKQSSSQTIKFWIIPSRKQLIAIVVILALVLFALVRITSVYLKHYLSKRKNLE